MRRTALALTVFASLAFAGTAFGAKSSYILRHGRCRAHYVRKVKHATVHGRRVRQVWCVHVPVKPKAPAPPVASGLSRSFTFVTSVEGGGFGLPAFKAVRVSVDSPGPGSGVAGVPVAVSLVSHLSGHVLVTFTQSSFGTPCAIVREVHGESWVLKGESAGSYPACPIGTVAPASPGDPVEIVASFAGNDQYAPSTSKQEPFA